MVWLRNIKRLWYLGILIGMTQTAGAQGEWQQTAYSMAAGEMGLLSFYRMEDDLIWRRSDDNRFASYKDLEEPVEGEDWWVKTYYRSDGFPSLGNISFSQDYSAILIGHESSLVREKWHGKLYEGAFYTMTSSNAYINAYDGKPMSYGSASNALTSYGGAVYAVWAGSGGKHVESVLRVANIRSTMAYTRGDGTSGLINDRLWLPSLGLRYYDIRFSKRHFFWEPQAGISAGYMRPHTIVDSHSSFRADNPFIVTGRVGVMAGTTYRIKGHDGLVYGRMDVQRNLSGPLTGSARETTDRAAETEITLGKGQTTWYDMTLGSSVALGKGNLLWGEYTKRFGPHVDTTWNVTGGLVVKWGGASKKEKEDFEKLKEDPRSMKTQF